ncbi:MAG: glutamate racemase [Coxiellaceae bacterium]|nr:MAG: glutamate racemase [Coxiellaceae bacterium]
MTQLSHRPIGIFDSGVGGLTVAAAVRKLLPREHLIYFGDTAHMPYGDKSTAAIQAYSVKICDMLLAQQCKVILIACNSASAAAYDLVNEYVGTKAKVLNVIDPVVNHLREYFANKRIGLIGTKQTVQSNIYRKKIESLNVGITLNSLATPLLAPMIEEGLSNKELMGQMIKEYLNNPDIQNIEALILGCTHYPLIKSQIAEFYNDRVVIIDSAIVVARALQALLQLHDLQNENGAEEGTMQFYVSDYTAGFAASTRLFFGDELPLEKYPLWE